MLHTLAPLLESVAETCGEESVGTYSELAETMEGACAKISANESNMYGEVPVVEVGLNQGRKVSAVGS